MSQPGSFSASELGASLTVKDIQKSLSWYRDVVGFGVSQEYVREGALRAVSLQAGSVRLLINQDDGGKGFDRVKGEGFSLQLTTSQSIDDIANGIKSRGALVPSTPSISNTSASTLAMSSRGEPSATRRPSARIASP